MKTDTHFTKSGFTSSLPYLPLNHLQQAITELISCKHGKQKNMDREDEEKENLPSPYILNTGSLKNVFFPTHLRITWLPKHCSPPLSLTI
jgi:hypothetical protein